MEASVIKSTSSNLSVNVLAVAVVLATEILVTTAFCEAGTVYRVVLLVEADPLNSAVLVTVIVISPFNKYP
jgi:hypothetical protein